MRLLLPLIFLLLAITTHQALASDLELLLPENYDSKVGLTFQNDQPIKIAFRLLNTGSEPVSVSAHPVFVVHDLAGGTFDSNYHLVPIAAPFRADRVWGLTKQESTTVTYSSHIIYDSPDDYEATRRYGFPTRSLKGGARELDYWVLPYSKTGKHLGPTYVLRVSCLVWGKETNEVEVKFSIQP